MASKDFSNKLKDLRLKAGYTQKDVYEHFKIPQSTFSSWEVGKSEPSGEMLVKLCNFYKCDMVEEFSSDNDLNYKEWEMIEKYRVLDSHGKKMVDFTLNEEWKRSQELKNEIKVEPTEFSAEIVPIKEHLIPNAAHHRTDIDTTGIPEDVDDKYFDE